MDDAAINEIAREFEASWNAHDMVRYAALFHPDASFINRFATRWHGRDAIREAHRQIHETVYRDCTLKVDAPEIDWLSAEAAVVHFWTRALIGPAHPAGPHQVDTLIMAVVTRQDGDWAIRAAENVTLTDPRTRADILRAG